MQVAEADSVAHRNAVLGAEDVETEDRQPGAGHQTAATRRANGASSEGSGVFAPDRTAGCSLMTERGCSLQRGRVFATTGGVFATRGVRCSLYTERNL